MESFKAVQREYIALKHALSGEEGIVLSSRDVRNEFNRQQEEDSQERVNQQLSYRTPEKLKRAKSIVATPDKRSMERSLLTMLQKYKAHQVAKYLSSQISLQGVPETEID